MTDDDLKKIKGVVEVGIETALEPIKQTLGEHSSKIDSLVLDMADVQSKTDVLPDLHSYITDTKQKVDDIEERVERLETTTKI